MKEREEMISCIARYLVSNSVEYPIIEDSVMIGLRREPMEMNRLELKFSTIDSCAFAWFDLLSEVRDEVDREYSRRKRRGRDEVSE